MKSEMLPVEISVKIRFKIFLACLVFIRKNFFFLSLPVRAGQNEMAVKGKTKKKLFELANDKSDVRTRRLKLGHILLIIFFLLLLKQESWL